MEKQLTHVLIEIRDFNKVVNYVNDVPLPFSKAKAAAEVTDILLRKAQLVSYDKPNTEALQENKETKVVITGEDLKKDS